MLRLWLGYGWAQPVTSRSWAFVACLLDAISRASGHRVLSVAKHSAWCKATA